MNKDARDKRFNDNKALVLFVVNGLMMQNPVARQYHDDLIQDGYTELLSLATSWVGKGKVRFSTYAFRILRKRLRDRLIQELDWGSRQTEFTEDVLDVATDNSKIDKDTEYELKKYLDSMPPLVLKIFHNHFCKGISTKQTAQIVGRRESNVRDIRNKLQEKITEILS